MGWSVVINWTEHAHLPLTVNSATAYSADMSKTLSELETEARQLPPKDRAKLVRRLIATLDPDDEGDIEQLWLDEAETRLAAYRDRETSSVPGEEVFEAILNRG